VIKVSGACTLSERLIPFPDIWDPSPACSMPGASTAACGHGLDTGVCRRQLEQAVDLPDDRPLERQ